MSKMGISTVQSYCGAQIFEAIGLGQEVIDKYFTWHAVAHRRHRPGRHRPGSPRPGTTRPSPTAAPTAILSTSAAITSIARKASITCSTRKPCTSCNTLAGPDNYKVFKEYSKLVNDQSRRLAPCAGLMEIKFCRARGSNPSADLRIDAEARLGPIEKSSRSRKSSSASRRERCRTAPSARKPTKRWPSP